MAKTEHGNKNGKEVTDRPKLRRAYLAIAIILSLIIGVVVGMFIFGQDTLFGTPTPTSVAGSTKDESNAAQFASPVVQSFVTALTPPSNNTYPLTNAPVTYPTGSFSSSVSNLTVNSVNTKLMNYPCLFSNPTNVSTTGFSLSITSCANSSKQYLGTNVGLGQSYFYQFKDQIFVVAFGNYPAVVYRGGSNAYYVCVANDTLGRSWRTPVLLTPITQPSTSIASCAATMSNGQPMLAIATAAQVPSAGVTANAIEIILSSSGLSFGSYNQYVLTGTYNAVLQPGMTLNLVNGLPVLNAYVSNYAINSGTHATTGQFLCFVANTNSPTSASNWTNFTGVSLGALAANQLFSTLNTYGYIASVQSSGTNIAFSTNPFQTISSTNGFGTPTATLAVVPAMNTPVRLAFLNTLPVIFYVTAATSPYNTVTTGNLMYNVATAYTFNTYTTGTVSQSGTTITGLGTTFTASMVGGGIVFASGGSAVAITAVNSATSLTVSSSQTVAAGTNFTITYFPSSFTLGNSASVDATTTHLAYEVTTLSSGNVGIAYITAVQTLKYALLKSTGVTIVPMGNMTQLASLVGLNTVNNIPYIAFGYANHPFAQITSGGTVSQASGSLTVTGTGTSFSSSLVGQSLFVLRNSNGDVYPCGVITAVASPTSLSVSMTYGGISGAYVIYPYYNTVYTSSTDSINQTTTTISENTLSNFQAFPITGCQIFANHTSVTVFDGVIQSVTNSNTAVTDTSLSFSSAPFIIMAPPSMAVYYSGTASQSNYTLTGNNTAWTSALQGMVLYYLSGVCAGTIVTVLSSTSMIVSNPLTIGGTFYVIFPMSGSVSIFGAGDSNNETFTDSAVVKYTATGQ